MRGIFFGAAVFLYSLSANAGTFATIEEAANYLSNYKHHNDMLFKPEKVDGVLRGFPLPVEQKLLDAIARREIASVDAPAARPSEAELLRLRNLSSDFAGRNVQLYVEVNLDHSMPDARGEYLSVFWRQLSGEFKHVFSEYVSASWNDHGTPLGVKSILDCDEFHCSSSYDNALMDFYEMLYVYPNGVGGGVHMSSHLPTMGVGDSAGCIRTRLAAAYRLFELRKLTAKNGGKIIYNIVEKPERAFAPPSLPPFAIYWWVFKNTTDLRQLADREKYTVLMASSGLADEMEVVTAAQGRHVNTRHGGGYTEPAAESVRKKLYEDFFTRWDVKPFTLDELEAL